MAFALASCLGGAPAGFHVSYQSERHFHFSVANKAMGFHVYALRHFIGNHFDAYFHLWQDRAANWEREKHLWEQEHQKEWTEVLSKAEKHKAKSSKRVTFASRLVFIPTKSSPSAPKFLVFGQFLAQVPQNSKADSIMKFGSVPRSCSSEVPDLKIPHATTVSNFEIKSSGKICGSPVDNHGFARLSCSKCLCLGHVAQFCLSKVWCKTCFNYGHQFRWCLTRTRPRLLWRPKVTVAPVQNPKIPIPVQNSTPSPCLVILENHDHNQSTVNHNPPPTDHQPLSNTMANFDVNPIPYIPMGFDLEHWARPACGRMVLAGNPPQRHEEYAIATLTPVPQPNNLHQLHQAITDVIDYFEGPRQVHIIFACPSPLGLCFARIFLGCY